MCAAGSSRLLQDVCGSTTHLGKGSRCAPPLHPPGLWPPPASSRFQAIETFRGFIASNVGPLYHPLGADRALRLPARVDRIAGQSLASVCPLRHHLGRASDLPQAPWPRAFAPPDPRAPAGRCITTRDGAFALPRDPHRPFHGDRERSVFAAALP